jgi:hypothetical protein
MKDEPILIKKLLEMRHSAKMASQDEAGLKNKY